MTWSSPRRRLAVAAAVVVVVVLTSGIAGSRRYLHARTDLFAVARVGAPVPVDRIRPALQDAPDVSVGAVHDLAVLQPVRGLRLTTDHPPPEEAARLVDLAARAGSAARRSSS